MISITDSKENSPSGLWRALGKRVECKLSGVRIPHSPQTNQPTVQGFYCLLGLCGVDSNVRGFLNREAI